MADDDLDLEESIAFPSTVLVVDDDPMVVSLFEQLLPDRDLSVVTASTAEEGIEVINNRGLGCVLTDNNLPGASGVEVIRHARQLQPYAACLMMTAHVTAESAIEVMRLGAIDYLEKPFQDLELVLARVDKAIRDQRAHFERESLMERIRDFEQQVSATVASGGSSGSADSGSSGGSGDGQRSEFQMFNAIVEARVRDATSDLRRKCENLEASLGGGMDVPQVLHEQLSDLLKYTREIVIPPSEGVAEAQKEFARIARRLENSVETLRNSLPAGELIGGAERRNHERLDFHGTVVVHLGDTPGNCRARDISAGGVFVQCDAQPALGTEATLDIYFSATDSPCRVRAVAVRVVPGAGVGFAFSAMSDTVADRLRQELTRIGIPEARSA